MQMTATGCGMPCHTPDSRKCGSDLISKERRSCYRREVEETLKKTINDLKVKLFADGADKAGMLEMYRKPFVKGFTTNPTLMRKAGVSDYRGFARDILQVIPDRPISFEVFSDDFDEMERQARHI